MEYAFIRGVITDLRFELAALFEHGFLQNARQEASLKKMADNLNEYGFLEASRLLTALCSELAQCRAQTNRSSEAASVLLAKLWQYSSFCQRRLELLEAGAALKDS